MMEKETLFEKNIGSDYGIQLSKVGGDLRAFYRR
jgi:hypothetical protein